MNVIYLAERKGRGRGNGANRNPRQFGCSRLGAGEEKRQTHRLESIGEIATRLIENMRG